MKLSSRLKTIADMVSKGSKVVDIGCDHALLGIYLTKNELAAEVIVSDISEQALNQGKENIKKYGLHKKIETRHGNGLEIIKDLKIDTIIISGLGGKTIIDILIKNPNNLKQINNIIVQPNNNTVYVRKKINNLGYIIDNEKLVKEKNNIYTIISFIKGHRNYSLKELYFGPILIKKKDDLFKEKCKVKLYKKENTYNKIPKTKIFKRFKILKEIILLKKSVT
jgi:tRNA (adenine22-N1)-methyltransferase